MANLSETERTRIRRAPTRSSDDAQELYRLLDEAYVCHVGFVSDGSPVVIPTLGWRVDDDIVFHGSRGSRMLKIIKAGGPFHHSANYRSAVIFGQPIVIEDRDEKLAALEVFMENIAPGRWDLLRETNKQEIEATDVLRLPLTEASLKIRAGDPIDDEEDLGHPIWAGVIPIHRQFGPTVDSKDNLPDQNPDDFSQVFKDAWTP